MPVNAKVGRLHIGAANDTHIEWALTDKHPTYQSSRMSIVMALVAREGGDEYRGPLAALSSVELTTLRNRIDEHAAARKAHR